MPCTHRTRACRPFRVVTIAACGCVGLAVCLATPGIAPAVIIETVTGTGNTTAPTDDPGWANVGALGIGTGVYLGNGWVLTAAHVGGGSIVLNGGTYAMLAGSGTRLTNGGASGKSTSTDLYLFRLATTPAGLAGVPIAVAATGSAAAVTMIGAGRDRGEFTQWSVNTSTGTNPWVWTEVSSGGNFAGYKTLESRTMRWGTNSVSGTGIWINAGFGDARTMITDFDDFFPSSTEAQAASGDSGGAVFHKNGSTWELSGLMLAVGGYSGQPDPATHAVFGNVTYAADLSFYRPQIMAIVPEPAAIVLVVTAAGGLLVARSLRRRRAAGSADQP